MNTISIPIPPDLLDPTDENLDETDLGAFFGDLIGEDETGENSGEFLQALDTYHSEERAVCHGVKIEDVEVGTGLIQVHVHYVVSHSAYYGCSDANWAADDTRSVTGRRVGDEWIFEVFVAPERLPPDMEGPDED